MTTGCHLNTAGMTRMVRPMVGRWIAGRAIGDRTVRLDHAANVLVISSSSTVRVMFAVTVITTMMFTVGATLADQAAWAIILVLILWTVATPIFSDFAVALMLVPFSRSVRARCSV